MSTTIDFPIRGAELARKRTSIVRISDEELERLGIIDTAQKAVYRAVAADSLKFESTIVRATGLDSINVSKALRSLMGADHIRRAAASPLSGIGPFVVHTRSAAKSTTAF